MRGRLSDAKSYAKPQEVGATMGGGAVGEVVASRNPKFKTGDFVVGPGGWHGFMRSATVPGSMRPIDAKKIPI